jgi:hypothetical protein
MFSSDGLDTDQIETKKEISKTFLLMGLASLCIGLLALFLGYLFEQNFANHPSLSPWALLISIPIIALVNWLLLRRLLIKIRSHSSGHD